MKLEPEPIRIVSDRNNFLVVGVKRVFFAVIWQVLRWKNITFNNKCDILRHPFLLYLQVCAFWCETLFAIHVHPVFIDFNISFLFFWRGDASTGVKRKLMKYLDQAKVTVSNQGNLDDKTICVGCALCISWKRKT